MVYLIIYSFTFLSKILKSLHSLISLLNLINTLIAMSLKLLFHFNPSDLVSFLFHIYLAIIDKVFSPAQLSLQVPLKHPFTPTLDLSMTYMACQHHLGYGDQILHFPDLVFLIRFSREISLWVTCFCTICLMNIHDSVRRPRLGGRCPAFGGVGNIGLRSIYFSINKFLIEG